MDREKAPQNVVLYEFGRCCHGYSQPNREAAKGAGAA
jgi:hypothetical protein